MPLSQDNMCCDFETQKTWNEMEQAPSFGNAESQSATAKPKKKGKGTRGPVIMKLPEFGSHEEKAAFMMKEFKVTLCTRRRRHAWSGCPYAHRGETARRRDPCTYHAVPCPEMRQGNRCPRGEHCQYSHHDFEYWLHPARYCTVMCNKGSKCDRTLCFFAHSPDELRTVPAIGDNFLNNNPSTPRDQLSDSSSSVRNNFEKTGLNGDDMMSCGCDASIPEAFAPLQRRNEHWTPRTNQCIPPTLINECPRVILSNKAPRTALIRPAISSTKKENVEPVFECPSSMTECTASSNISQLLPQRHSSPGMMNFHQGPFETDEKLLRTRLSSQTASHFSPTCHFSGSSREFTNEVTPKAVSSSSRGFITGLEGFGGTNQDCVDWMHRDQSMLAAQNCSAMDIKQLDLMQCAQMNNPATQALDQNGGCTHQAMDYLRSLEQCPASQTAALYPFASSPLLFGDQTRQDLLRNVETLQLLKLQLLCSMQGGELQSPTSLFPPSLLNPQFSCEEPRSRDALYSLQEETSVFNMLPYLNLIQTTGVNTDNQF